jgi:hypothetical protein
LEAITQLRSESATVLCASKKWNDQINFDLKHKNLNTIVEIDKAGVCIAELNLSGNLVQLPVATVVTRAYPDASSGNSTPDLAQDYRNVQHAQELKPMFLTQFSVCLQSDYKKHFAQDLQHQSKKLDDYVLDSKRGYDMPYVFPHKAYSGHSKTPSELWRHHWKAAIYSTSRLLLQCLFNFFFQSFWLGGWCKTV